MPQKKLPTEVTDAFKNAAILYAEEKQRAYAESKAKTDAGRVLRFLAYWIPLESLVKMLVHKSTK